MSCDCRASWHGDELVVEVCELHDPLNLSEGRVLDLGTIPINERVETSVPHELRHNYKQGTWGTEEVWQ